MSSADKLVIICLCGNKILSNLFPGQNACSSCGRLVYVRNDPVTGYLTLGFVHLDELVYCPNCNSTDVRVSYTTGAGGVEKILNIDCVDCQTGERRTAFCHKCAIFDKDGPVYNKVYLKPRVDYHGSSVYRYCPSCNQTYKVVGKGKQQHLVDVADSQEDRKNTRETYPIRKLPKSTE